MSVAIAALVLLAPGVAQGMTEIGAVEEPVPVRVFPIAGPHDLGRSPTNGFGGGRGHSGQDMFAACGTPVVASQGGKVRKAGYHPVGGNFIVLTEKETGLDAVYMHLAHRPRLRARETVETDQRIGSVGDTGNARRLPPALRAVVGAGLVRRRRAVRSAAAPTTVGRAAAALVAQ